MVNLVLVAMHRETHPVFGQTRAAAKGSCQVFSGGGAASRGGCRFLGHLHWCVKEADEAAPINALGWVEAHFSAEM